MIVLEREPIEETGGIDPPGNIRLADGDILDATLEFEHQIPECRIAEERSEGIQQTEIGVTKGIAENLPAVTPETIKRRAAQPDIRSLSDIIPGSVAEFYRADEARLRTEKIRNRPGEHRRRAGQQRSSHGRGHGARNVVFL
jgi:hypothetical protein